MDSKKYIGMDVHQATVSVAVMDSRGRVVMGSVIETKRRPSSSSSREYAERCG